jgi:hypothetical protein
MTTILLINAGSTLLATVGIGGFLVRRSRQVRRKTEVQPAYVATGRPRPLPHA